MMKRRWFLVGIMILIMILIGCVSASAERGTYRGVSWDLTDGVLTLGNGNAQTMVSGNTSWPWSGNKASITSVVCDGTIVFNGSIQGMFSGCSNMESIDTSGWDVSGVTSMSSMFYNCSKITSIGTSNWNVASVTSMSSMFEGCGKLVDLDVSEWDVGNVVYMGTMFRGCSSLVFLAVGNWDVKNVTSMNNMFNGCSRLQVLDVSHWNTVKLRDIAGMFGGCGQLRELSLGSWKTDALSGSIQWLFTYCASLTSLDLGSWNLTNVSSIDTMFKGCTNLKSLNISGWDTSHISDFINMYENCPSLCEVTLGDKNPFKGDSSAPPSRGTVTLPTPPSSKNGIPYTRKWIRDDKSYGPYTPAELRDNYTAAMAGKWVWEEAPRRYTIKFVSSDSSAIGSMSQVTTLMTEDYELPVNRFQLIGYKFDHWEDSNGNAYNDCGTVSAYTYNWNDVVTLTAVFVPKDTSVVMRDGQFSFSINGGEEALFNGVPAGTSYQVFEENLPDDWVLVAQAGTTGVVGSLDVSNARFSNKYQPDMATMQFTGRKFMDEQPAEADSFSFELWEDGILLQTKPVVDGGFVQFDILEYDKTMAGLHHYVIKELVGTDDGVLYDGHEEKIVVSVTTETDENHIVHVYAEVTQSDGTYPDIVFQNWTKPGELTLKKLVDDVLAGHGSDEFRFRITFIQENGLPLNDILNCVINP